MLNDQSRLSTKRNNDLVASLFLQHARCSENNLNRAAEITDCKWDGKYSKNQSELLLFNPTPCGGQKKFAKPALVQVNCLFSMVFEDSSHSCTNKDLLQH